MPEKKEKKRSRLSREMRVFWVVFIWLAVCFLLGGCAEKRPDGSLTGEDFAEFTNEVFKESVQGDGLTFHYTLSNPEDYGIKDCEPELGEYGLTAMKKGLAENENYFDQLLDYNYESLSEEQQLTYDILEKYLEEEQLPEELLLYNEAIRPQSGLPSQLPVLFAEYRFYGKEDVEEYLKLLGELEGYFSDILRFEQEKAADGLFMGDKTVQKVINQCNQFVKNPEENYLIGIFEEKLTSVEDLSQKEKRDYGTRNRQVVVDQVIPAYKLLSKGLSALLGSGKYEGGLCNYPKGKEYYEYMAAAYTGSDRSVKEMREKLDQTIEEKTQEMRDAFLAEGTAEAYDQYEFPESDPEKILSYLETEIKEDFPEFPSTNYEIKQVNEKLEESLSPAFYMTPAIDRYEENVIYINNSKIGEGNELFPTIAHEGYPGHMFQTVYFDRLKADPIRYLLNFPGYQEGWGTYSEAYSYELAGIDPNVAIILQDDLILSLSMYARIDIGVNYDGWREEDVENYLEELGLTDSSQAGELYDISVSEPCLYLKYIMGYLEIMDLRTEAENVMGKDFSLKRFHTFFLNEGPAPFSVLEDRIEEID